MAARLRATGLDAETAAAVAEAYPAGRRRGASASSLHHTIADQIASESAALDTWETGTAEEGRPSTSPDAAFGPSRWGSWERTGDQTFGTSRRSRQRIPRMLAAATTVTVAVVAIWNIAGDHLLFGTAEARRTETIRQLTVATAKPGAAAIVWPPLSSLDLPTLSLRIRPEGPGLLERPALPSHERRALAR